jgi:uncharacterized protein YdhG (YjbR/CyaY superfamily)
LPNWEGDPDRSTARVGRAGWLSSSCLSGAKGAADMNQASAPGSIDDYIGGFPPETQLVLQQLRSLIHERAPEATETISYAMPTFDMNGRHLMHFAGYGKHVSLYPGASSFEEFRDELAPYKNSKSTARFAIDRPLPADLIRRIVTFRVIENRAQFRL